MLARDLVIMYLLIMREQKVDPSLLKFVITRKQLMNLRETEMSWAKIATCFGMSVKEV